MNWNSYYRGDGRPRDVKLPAPPPWRAFPQADTMAARVFQPPEGLRDAVNAALCLRRPLLITGSPGSGKSTLIQQVATELKLGPVLNWHITSRSVVTEALYRYDALGRIYAQRQGPVPGATGEADDIAQFLQLGPLGTALVPSPRPRALLIDELDKGDLDLPGDLLDVLERGVFEIREIIREKPEGTTPVRMWESDEKYPVPRGRVQCTQFPFIVMTSNGEQQMPAPFLRRCVRFVMPRPSAAMLSSVIRGWLDVEVPDDENSKLRNLVDDFLQGIDNNRVLAVDQLLNAVHLLSGAGPAQHEDYERLRELLLGDLSGA